MYAGARIMMGKLGVNKIDKVILAGAFGSYVDKESMWIPHMKDQFPNLD